MLSNLNSGKWISTNSKPADVYLRIKEKKQKDPTAKFCPLSKPFVSGSECIACAPREYFSFDSERCESCARGTVFSVNTHSCIESIGTGVHQTNPTTAPNLVLGGISIAQYESTYASNKASYPDITDCPADRPYFDNINCVACTEPFPYFNMYSRLCQSCSEGSKYNSQTRECEDAAGRMSAENPTIERMLSSIF